MNIPLIAPEAAVSLPDHTQLPDRDGNFVKNFQEHPQSILLTDALTPVLRRKFPDERFCIGQDCGIYWRLTRPPEAPQKGAVCPDWFFVAGVPAKLAGRLRRSYVLWQEHISPSIVVEFVSGDGSEERDRTPGKGKFWIYEQILHVPFYGIYEVEPGRVEVYHLVNGRYVQAEANARGRFEVPALDAELGIWQGRYQNLDLPWLRFWDLNGSLLPTGQERADEERQRADEEWRRADEERRRADEERRRAETAEQEVRRLQERLRTLGIDPEKAE